MKRFFVSTIALAAALLVFGCHHETPPPKPPKVVKVKPVKPAKPVKVAKEARPGTPAYLDAKNGFRDFNFGTPSANFTDLSLVEDDSAHQLKTYVRSNEDLSLVNVPLQKVEYTFFDDKLCQITLYWTVQYPNNSQRQPTTTELSGYCSTLYGHPEKRRTTKDNTFYVWHGQKTGVMLTENLMPGVPDVTHGRGWAIAPTTSGEMVLYSEPLRRTVSQLIAKQGGTGM